MSAPQNEGRLELSTITWSEIEAECDGYRAGFVATFRKYEGALTDELDGQGRPTVVSQRSFCAHMGIPRATLQDWLNRVAGGQPPRDRDRTRESLDRMPLEEEAKLIAERLDNPEVAEQVEQHRIAQRGPTFGPLPEPAEVGRRAGDNMARKLDTDLATGALRSAAGSVAEAILCKEQFGIRNQAEYAEALARLRHLVAAIESDDKVSDDDRSWLASIGVEL